MRPVAATAAFNTSDTASYTAAASVGAEKSRIEGSEALPRILRMGQQMYSEAFVGNSKAAFRGDPTCIRSCDPT